MIRKIAGTAAALSAAVLAAATAVPAAAQEFPSQRLELVVPLTPGSAPDILARLVGDRLRERLGQSVVVMNRPGAATQVAMTYLKRSKADGHTLLLMHSGMTATALVQKAYTGDVIGDHTYVASISTTPYVLAIHRSIPAETLADFVKYARVPGRRLNFGSTGGAYDIDAIRLMRALGFDAQLVGYPGGSQQMAAIASNEVQVTVVSVRSAQAILQNIRLLAVASPKRFSLADHLPTFDELGFGPFHGAFWYGIIGPAGMTAAVTSRLNREINEILAEPEIRKRIVDGLTNEVVRGSPADFETLARQTYEYYRRTAEEAGIKPQ